MGEKFREPIAVKKTFLALIIVAIASVTSGLLAACSRVSSQASQTPNSPTANAGSMQPMQHRGDMNHSMVMDLGSADANYDLRFIDAMTLHHQGAIEMAKEAQQKSQRLEIKKLAQNILTAQNREINQLKQW
jgi:uncharacterized protein (DUF305 family)